MSKRINATTTRHKVPHPLLSLLIEALNKHITETTTRQKSTALPFDHCLRKHIKACQSNYHTSKKYHTPSCHCLSSHTCDSMLPHPCKRITAYQSNYHTSKKYHTPSCHCLSILHMRFYATSSSQAYQSISKQLPHLKKLPHSLLPLPLHLTHAILCYLILHPSRLKTCASVQRIGSAGFCVGRGCCSSRVGTLQQTKPFASAALRKLVLRQWRRKLRIALFTRWTSCPGCGCITPLCVHCGGCCKR